MAFLSGPRQVGKTTLAKKFSSCYLDWDNVDARALILKGPSAAAGAAGLERLSFAPLTVAFDEIHKYRRWKDFLKGFFDTYENDLRVIATGSARMDIYSRGGDSLMGRYFPYRIHPFSVAELVNAELPTESQVIHSPRPINDEDWTALLTHGGFPEPFLRREAAFTRRWRSLRAAQLLKKDVTALYQTTELAQLEVLARLLALRSGEQLVAASLAGEVRVSENTIREWVTVLKTLYYGFELRPWFRNIENSLRKTPKWYLRDWASVADAGKRAETLIACHLLKAVEGWTDLGLGEFELFYLRDKKKREVDFLVVRNGEPWFLAEAKKADEGLSPTLAYFQQATKARHAFQVVLDLPYIEADCFLRTTPVIVPARTFLSQLF
ncbi:MAG: ATP-binding protein [Kiritimatiellae bacterium]|nr:ATP-binding protein [Kiritimatiellia bacterium]